MSSRRGAAVAVLLWAAVGTGSEKLPVSAEGTKMLDLLDALDVENHWKAGEHITQWRTGEADGKTGGPRTHCSLFVAAVCWKLDVPMLNPPPQTFLANRQQDWLLQQGKEKGWKQIRDVVEAQRLANRGSLVLASYKNPDPKKAGHIAVLRAGELTAEAVQEKGPRITQAGTTNFKETDVKQGFRHHPGAWERGEILYFAYLPPSR
jgi:hypothetical protein